MNSKNRDRLAPVLILTAGTLWGSMGLFVRRLGSGVYQKGDRICLRYYE